MIVALSKKILWQISPWLYRTILSPLEEQEFSLGMIADSTLEEIADGNLQLDSILTKSDITDIPAAFIADPFFIQRDGTLYLFFEILNELTRQGCIGYAVSNDAAKWEYKGRVLEESFHLAYPQVFAHDDDVFMIPDTPQVGIGVYRATNFPLGWRKVHSVTDRQGYSDPTFLKLDDDYWIFATRKNERDSGSDLHIFHAESILGPWTEHDANPVVQNSGTARSAGRLIVKDGRILRLVQDNAGAYGTSVHALEISELSLDKYSEKLAHDKLLGAGPQTWRLGGMHHMDFQVMGGDLAGRTLAVVDGWNWSAKVMR